MLCCRPLVCSCVVSNRGDDHVEDEGGETPDVSVRPLHMASDLDMIGRLDRRRVHGDDVGTGRDLCKLGLYALTFCRELIDLRVVR